MLNGFNLQVRIKPKLSVNVGQIKTFKDGVANYQRLLICFPWYFSLKKLQIERSACLTITFHSLSTCGQMFSRYAKIFTDL